MPNTTNNVKLLKEAKKDKKTTTTKHLESFSSKGLVIRLKIVLFEFLSHNFISHTYIVLVI